MDCRLQYAQELQVWLQKEIDQRTILYNRYKCHTNTIDYIILGSQFVSVIASASGVGVLTTIVAAPIAIALGTVAAVFGGLSMASKVASRRFTMKAKKHDDIRILAEATLNRVQDLVSTALSDSHMDENEYHLILLEKEKYMEEKQTIRLNRNISIDCVDAQQTEK